MASLALYWSVMIACYLLASRLRRYADRLGFVNTLLSISVYALVFVMGLRMGANREVTDNLAVRAHAQTHHENERVDADAQQRIDKAETVGVAAQARGEQVAGDHDRPVEGERGHREYLPFKKEGGVLRRPPFAL